MRAILIVSLILTIFAIVLPLMAASPPVSPAGGSAASKEEGLTGGDTVSQNEPASGYDENCSVSLLDNGEVMDLTLSQYLVGSLAAEMPASFEPEALKAQAVALRTYYLYHVLVDPTDAHPEAQVCSDSTCCAAWCSDEDMHGKWGGDYSQYIEKIEQAVRETDGLCIVYDGEPALAVFHSSSAGKTESSGSVWSGDLPYLVSVDSPEDASSVPNYVSSVTVSASEFRETVAERCPDAVFGDDPALWLGEAAYTTSGRLGSIEIGGVPVSGTALRSMFSLRSTAVEITTDGSTFTMTTTGYGHGVGMSQYGANVMAAEGSDYESILSAYYPGTSLVYAGELDA